MATDIDIIKGLAQNNALLTEREIQAIAYPNAPGTAKRPPSYVSAVAHQAAMKVVKVGYRLIDEDAELPLNPYTEQAENFRHVHINELKLVELKEDVYSEGQQDMKDAGFRQVLE